MYIPLVHLSIYRQPLSTIFHQQSEDDYTKKLPRNSRRKRRLYFGFSCYSWFFLLLAFLQGQLQCVRYDSHMVVSFPGSLLACMHTNACSVCMTFEPTPKIGATTFGVGLKFIRVIITIRAWE